MPPQIAEHKRLVASQKRAADWKNWGPYLAERAWGTVREDYSATGEAWDYFPFEHAHARAYRWNEDGLGGFCNRFQNLCLSVALWNGQDPVLKERLFGLSGPQGNHGEDVKEVYHYLDGLPSHAYMKMRYRYPQVAFPYEDLVNENARRGHADPEFELGDALAETFEAKRYFDVTIEYAKAGEEDILCRITAHNCGPDAAPLHVLPHLWFRNTWSWDDARDKPQLREVKGDEGSYVLAEHKHLGQRWWYAEQGTLLFTENETNQTRLFGASSAGPYTKDGVGAAVIRGDTEGVNPAKVGTKVAAHVQSRVAAGETLSVKVRFTDKPLSAPFETFDAVFDTRIAETDAFYDALHPPTLSAEEKTVQRQAFAGLLWSKQFYHYSVDLWLKGDPAQPPPPEARRGGRNRDWQNLTNLDVLSMPDAWEYPWYAAWDLAFHTVPLALIDPEWAKRQLVLMLREWYMHPNGQLPAYEWAFGDVNPPVHAWAAWQVYELTKVDGQGDVAFLERVFHKLLLNFTWWVNREDGHGDNIFQGGFLGLDNIGVFDRSAALPTGGHLEQADGTAWMGLFCLNMLEIALELAHHRPVYEDVATKFFEHFVYIASAINHTCGNQGLWDEADGFYYDMLHCPDGSLVPLKVRSFVGLIPLFAVMTLKPERLRRLPRFEARVRWFLRYRPQLLSHLAPLDPDSERGMLLSIVNRERLERMLGRIFDPEQFFSPHGLRSLSKEHAHAPYTFDVNGQRYGVGYEPGTSQSGTFGGNSNWRGPVWFPVNYLMSGALSRYADFYGGDLTVALEGQPLTLADANLELQTRLTQLFLRTETGSRPFEGDSAPTDSPDVLFHEYFHGDTGAGLGASHQTGWTALVANLLSGLGKNRTG